MICQFVIHFICVYIRRNVHLYIYKYVKVNYWVWVGKSVTERNKIYNFAVVVASILNFWLFLKSYFFHDSVFCRLAQMKLLCIHDLLSEMSFRLVSSSFVLMQPQWHVAKSMQQKCFKEDKKRIDLNSWCILI